MKISSVICCIVLLAYLVPGQAQTYSGSSITTKTRLQSSDSIFMEQTVYDNGLGDVVQEIQSFPYTEFPSIVVHHQYDEYRRKVKTWLPVTSYAGSSYISKNMIQYQAMNMYSDNVPCSQIIYDGFLQSQPAMQSKPGSQWQSNATNITYSEYVGIGMCAHEDGYMYTTTATKYLCTHTIDEDNCVKAEYTDFTGRLRISETSQGKTYYIYDAKGDIKYVLPPALSEYIITAYGYDSENIMDTDDMMQKYAYIYRYDNLRRCIYKKLPGCAPVYYLYDKAGNCILTQDGNQRERSEWTFTMPDKFGRPCVSGICTYYGTDLKQRLASTHVFVEFSSDAADMYGYIMHADIHFSSQAVYTVSYYDNYDFIGKHGIPLTLRGDDENAYPVDTTKHKGLLTGNTMAYFDENGVAGYTHSAIYYDSVCNKVQIINTNHIGGYEITHTKYTYTGKPLSVYIKRNINSIGNSERYTYTYDGADRVTEVKHKLDNYREVVLGQNSYNSLGQLQSVSKGYGNNNHTVNYTYDMHSWLTSISVNNRFEEQLMYANSNNPCYNGNISALTWKAGNMNVLRGYNFEYDDASRLTCAAYSENNINNGKYSTQYEYDSMGNITSLTRNGRRDNSTYDTIDQLSLIYDGNHLTSVCDSESENDPTYNNAWNFVDGENCETEYEYDENGNVTKDLNRNILSIQYNSLNLPTKIMFEGNKSIRYTYSADGRKLKAEYITAIPASTKRIDYCGSLIYENLQKKQLLVEGGYIPLDDWSAPYSLYVKDHLGNVRVVLHQSGMAEQVNHYYPYGGLMAESSGWSAQRYKYNGKELDRMHGLDWYDYGARWMDASIGRWHTMDPLCEKYYDVSPYAYCGGDPINRADLHGDSITILDMASIDAIYNALPPETNLSMKFDNGVLNPGSIRQVASNSQNVFLQDLYAIATNPQMVEIATTYVNDYYIGNQFNSNSWTSPSDIDYAKEFNNGHESLLYPSGKTIVGNLGQTLYPISSDEYKKSANNNIRININALGNINQRSCGIAHEFGHVILYLNGQPHGHSNNAEFIYARQWNVMKRLGYDYLESPTGTFFR